MRLVACLLVLTLGCGLTMVNGPASGRPPTERPDCTSSDHLIRVDAGLGAAGVFAALLGIALVNIKGADKDVGAAVLLGGLGLTVTMLVSSGVGYSKVKKCRKALDDYNRAFYQVAPPPPATY